ncbi:MAG: helix-turn-helix domain-containing protein [Desulfovibrionaceae bacterium]
MEKKSGTSARRALRVLKALKGHSLHGLSNTELAQGLDETPVNICRALEPLVAEGLVTRLENGRYAHSVAMLQVAQAHANEMATAQDRLMEINRRVAAGAM